MDNTGSVPPQGGVTISGGTVNARGSIIGRDLNISIALQDVTDAAHVTREIVKTLTKGDLENETIRGELLSLMEELRKTHSTLVKAISPLRRVPDAPGVFEIKFREVYNDFRDFYDAHDFWEERTHCHKVGQIQYRLEKSRAPITQTPQWIQLQGYLSALGKADIDVIEQRYRPFMQRFNQVMVEINRQITNGDVSGAVKLKQTFLDELTPQYEEIKKILSEMTETIAEIEDGLS
jgi:hypothetical protein